MAKLYANENFRRRVVEALRALGHDVLTSFEAGNANQGIPDDAVLDFARAHDRIVLTFNRKDFIRLHFQNPIHHGIIVCTEDRDNAALTNRIHETIESFKDNTANQLIRVNRPS
jgi:predicted nuclease of predicted toxin-antitoxin system